MTDHLYPMQLNDVPFSSVVGKSLTITDRNLGAVAQLVILVPQPRLDYRVVAEAVAKALLSGHVSREGVTLVLPDGFVAGPANGEHR